MICSPTLSKSLLQFPDKIIDRFSVPSLKTQDTLPKRRFSPAPSAVDKDQSFAGEAIVAGDPEQDDDG